jgi:signal transduction histidine kinase
MILIVDDRPENIFSLKSLLEINGFKTDSAESGEEALKKVLKTDYALIILDVQMPGMDGFEVAEALTGFTKTKDIPIIFLSALNKDKSFITKGYNSGGIDYVTKPVDTDILMLKVKTFHKLSSQKKELTLLHKDLNKEIESRKQVEIQLEKANEILEQKVHDRTLELQLKNEELKTSVAELQQFAWVASHDLKEPLRKIKTFSSMIKGSLKEEDAEINSYLEGNIRSAARMEDLINDLLDYSKLSIKSQFKSTPLNPLIQEVLADLQHLILDKKAIVHVAKLPLVDCIQTEIRQVFQNLISNALKFSSPAIVPEITISSEYTSEKVTQGSITKDGPYCRITVTDNGIGFNEKYLDKIFVIFQRLHGGDTFEGTGIGLAITKKIIDKHKGFITARSAEDKGASFIIVLPLNQDTVKQTQD